MSSLSRCCVVFSLSSFHSIPPAHLHVSLATVNGSTVELIGGLGSVTSSLESHVDDSGRVSALVVHHGAGGDGADLGLEVVLNGQHESKIVSNGLIRNAKQGISGCLGQRLCRALLEVKFDQAELARIPS